MADSATAAGVRTSSHAEEKTQSKSNTDCKIQMTIIHHKKKKKKKDIIQDKHFKLTFGAAGNCALEGA